MVFGRVMHSWQVDVVFKGFDDMEEGVWITSIGFFVALGKRPSYHLLEVTLEFSISFILNKTM
jgi:hypothetical protein